MSMSHQGPGACLIISRARQTGKRMLYAVMAMSIRQPSTAASNAVLDQAGLQERTQQGLMFLPLHKDEEGLMPDNRHVSLLMFEAHEVVH